MKKIIFVLIIILSCSGCLKRDTMEDIDIYTSVYPIEYIMNRLYGTHSNVESIYPDGIIVEQYSLTDKQIKDYSKCGLFAFAGLSLEKDYILPMRDVNNSLKIIDATNNMEYDNGIEELWLDPSNLLMMAQNIRIGLNEYINNQYLKTSINEEYEKLRVEISGIDAKLYFLAENAENKVIVTSSDMFKFLEKYNMTVYSLEENENLTEKVKVEVEELIKNGKVNYIFMKQNEDANDTIKGLMDKYDINLVTYHSLTNISENERKNKNDYISIMNDNIELLKDELY